MEIERELDRLYSLPLEEFTGARNELAARLRMDGDKEAAETVKAARKPTQPAWVANQLARSERKLVGALIAATGALAAAGGDEARDLIADQRDALAALGRTARKLAPAAADRAIETVRAAAIDPEARELLRIGRLTKEVEPSGFPAAGDTVVQAAARGKARGADELAERRGRREEEQRRLRELRERARTLDRAASEAEREANRAQGHADALQTEAEEAREAADEAAGEFERAEAQSRRSAKRPASSGRTRRR